jgi:hypothetical protein
MGLILATVLGLGALAAITRVGPEPSWAEAAPRTQAEGSRGEALPIIDVHFHAEAGWPMDQLGPFLEALGVVLAAGGPRRVSDQVGLDFARQLPGRYLPFAVGPVNDLLCNDEAGWNLETDDLRDYLASLEPALQSGTFRAIGELWARLVRFMGAGAVPCTYPADSPAMQALWSLSARQGVPLMVHMEGDPEAIEEMERLLASDRSGTWVWYHCGFFVDTPLLRELLVRHPNLYCDLSFRVSIRRTAPPTITIDTDGALRPEWKELIEDFSDRFMVGTDSQPGNLALYADLIAFWRNILDQLSQDAASQVAHRNAQRLLGIDQLPNP